MIEQRPEGKLLMGQSTVRRSLLQTKASLITSPPDITLLSRHLLLDVTWSTFTSLGSYHLPKTVSISSYAPPSLQKAHSYASFHKAGWKGFTAESERRFEETPLPTSCSAGEKLFCAILSDARRYHIPCGYVRDYCGPLLDVVRPLITERDQRSTDDPLTLPSASGPGHPAAHLPGSGRPVEDSLGFLRPRHQSQALLFSAAQARRPEVESPTKHLNRLREKTHSSSKAIAQAYPFRPTRSGTALSVPPNTIRHSEG